MTPTSFPPGWSKGWQRASELARAVIEEELATEFLNEPQAARTTITACPPGSLVLVGASMPIRDVDNFSAARSDIHLLGNRGLNGIDGFNSTALGVAAASGRPTYALCGDLTFLHDQGGLLDATRRDVRLTYVVLNNNGGGIFSFLPQAELPEHFEEVFGTPQAVDLSRLCSTHGIEHQIVGEAPALADLLEKPIRGIRVIEVRTERSANVALHQRLRARVKKTLDESFGQVELPSRAASTARSLRRVSSSSASGSEAGTIPPPAKRRPFAPSISMQRRAIPNSPSPLASTQPTGPA